MKGLVAILLLCTAAAPVDAQRVSGVRSPAIAADGRLAVSIAGDLWVLPPASSGEWGAGVRITGGPSWDRDPAWAPDGTLVFASDRSGAAADLWRVAVQPDARPERLTTSGDHDTEPTVAGDGTIAFVRGRGGDSDLWLRMPDGAEVRLTTEPGAEREPAWAPGGARLAYVAMRGAERQLRVRARSGGREETLLTDRAVRAPRWSPDGSRIAFATEGRDAGLWVAQSDGRYPQPLLMTPARAAWTPDGAWLVVAELDGGDGGYNGDPDRLGERRAGDMFRGTGGLRRLPAPAPLVEPVPVTLPLTPDAGAFNAAAYDRVWTRVARLYYGLEGATASPVTEVRGESSLLAEWRRVGRQHRAAAVEAGSSEALEDAIWAALRARPQRSGAVGRAGVSSAHPLATAAGLEILAQGGNVVDAAVAVSFALGVVEPDASGIGGYGEMLIQLEGMAEPTALEFMSTVPAAAAVGSLPADALPRAGAAVANVPGTVAGMAEAWRKYGSGRIAWAALLAPAVRLARDGFAVDDALATTLRRERAELWRHAGSRTLFFRGGEPLAAGDTLRNPALAETLRQIGAEGAAHFYSGALAQAMVADLRRGGNLMTVEDVAGYRAMERRPVRTSYRGNDVFSGPPPVTGGATLVARLNLLERAAAGGAMVEDAAKLHAMLEAVKFQPSTSGRIHDPELWPIDVTPFESKDTAAARWRCFSPARAAPANALLREDCGVAPDTQRSDGERSARAAAVPADECLMHDRTCRGTGTTAFVVADAAGNIVSVTQTLGTWGGNFYVSPELGFLYNDKLRSYGSNAEAPNARLAGARHTTTITPTIVFRGRGASRRPWFGVGAAGNAWIGSAVFTTVVGIVDEGLSAQQALELPRFLGTSRVQIEDAFSPRVVRELEAIGHVLERISLMGELRMGYGAVVLVRNGRVEAAGDPRRSGTGGVIR